MIKWFHPNEDSFNNMTLDEMTDYSLKMIESLFNHFDRPVVACSWGKDSLVVLHLVKQVADSLDKEFDVLWNNTGVHYPDVYRVKRQLEEKWNLNIIETKAQKSFWEIVDEYGWPGVVSSAREKDKASTGCCYHIKKKPTKDAIKQNGWDLYFDGLTAYESDRRWMALKYDYGLSHHHKTFGLRKYHPVGWWTVNDIWDYIEKENIPYPDIYDKEVEGYTKRGYSEQVCGHRVDRSIRSGCWCCTLAVKSVPGKMKQLRNHYPKMWRHLMESGLAKQIAKIKLNGQGSLFDGYFEDNEDHYLDERPCFFDSL